jgi:DNA-binding GntR family transcriptional regulator
MTTPAVQQRPPRPKPLGVEIVEALQREIIGGKFKPGQRLVERELIRRFRVSSIPIREALQELQNRGLAVKRHNCGCSVVHFSRVEVARICELRRVLEPQVMEWAARRITKEGAQRLELQLRELESAAKAKDYPRFFQEDLKFHRMIWEVADNAYAMRALETVMGSLFASGIIGGQNAKRLDLRVEVQKHRRLLDAISDSDRQRAALALLEIAAGFETYLP